MAGKDYDKARRANSVRRQIYGSHTKTPLGKGIFKSRGGFRAVRTNVKSHIYIFRAKLSQNVGRSTKFSKISRAEAGRKAKAARANAHRAAIARSKAPKLKPSAVRRMRLAAARAKVTAAKASFQAGQKAAAKVALNQRFKARLAKLAGAAQRAASGGGGSGGAGKATSAKSSKSGAKQSGW